MTRPPALIPKAEVAEVPFTAFRSRRKAERIPGRLIVRRIPDLNPRQVEQPTLWRPAGLMSAGNEGGTPTFRPAPVDEHIRSACTDVFGIVVVAGRAGCGEIGGLVRLEGLSHVSSTRSSRSTVVSTGATR